MTEVQINTVESQDADIRLDRWFRTRYPGIGHGVIEKLLRTGQIRVDGRRVKASFRLEAGQKVRFLRYNQLIVPSKLSKLKLIKKFLMHWARH